MNEENSYESDISEGWSLIDFNLNEESTSTSETQLDKNEDRLQPGSANSNLKKANSLQSVDSLKNNLNIEVESTCSSLSNLSCDENSPPNEEITSNYKEISMEEKEPTVSEPVNDSCDAESIEILDTDGNYRDSDIDNLDVVLIEKQDLYGSEHLRNIKSLCKEYNTHHFSTLSRKRRKLSRDSESSVDNFESEKASFDGRRSCKTKVLKIETCEHHVYRHYRNNVANTVLNLSMRIIFAGVACIAIGHFLGVHDGEGIAGELYDTLKKVQMENVALQSRVSQLNRALFTREAASKWESDLNKPPCNKDSNLESEKSGNDPTPQPEIQPDFNSDEWMLKVEKFIEKGCKNNEKVDATKITDYLHDLFTFLRRDKKEVNKIPNLEDTNAKISKLLHKMVVKLSSSQENFENLYSKFLKLKDKFNKKISKFFPDSLDENVCRSQEGTQKNLNSMQWKPVRKSTQSTILTENSKPNPETRVSFCIFPQTEEYYLKNNEDFSKKENTSSSIVGTDDGNTNEKETPENEEVVIEIEEERLEKEKKSGETKEDKMKERQNEKITKKDTNERDSKMKQSNNQHKRFFQNKSKKTERVKRVEKTNKRKFDTLDSKDKHSKKTKRGLGEGKRGAKKSFKTKKQQQVVRQEIKVSKKNRKSVNSPKEFWTKKEKQEVWLEPDQFFGSQFRPKEEKLNGDGKFVNFTGDWFFRLSKGRDEFRRQEILSDWQFERAKARTGWRNGEKFNQNWQFLRALAREDNRMEKLSNSRK